ncbi:MAG: hypothetical protein A2931_01210 [Candidatus Niyogibacteria bacterium RIFCSPLOWO2_01_FULL_45_48]|uniref:Uncharacterized protein n=2 Tax=Candidatus Niyogiibacteriota TaxID=1817912 RepID=A0A1G2EYM7_9BACT|nr:MAG: hypothetical protein A2835_02460 [Candidatus Niyogibacteria bacterium RIFCSPHIGHO2_01_FULL_45_28]OGZ29672.1 MAG: hypothetical protein A2931_01210 [Candidatus Niyogibacteria bacterium RIFCSPLOWO2_01_FULL_45_48]OGZ30461.1 MAG: hypothetical protein A3J00_04300 [Candidatus Niyogibacteria bacterium RIFCSPLOWO2_02_FULL_45_13]
MALDLNHFRRRLDEERLRVEGELKTIAKISPDNPKDWQSVPPETDIQPGEISEMADRFEEMGNRAAREIELETRLNEINAAITRIEKRTYGHCSVDQVPIPEARLEANPAAETCIEHATG